MFTNILLDLCLSVAALTPADDPLPPGAIVRLGSTKLGHYSPVTWVGFSADGRAAITAGSQWMLRFWDVATGRESASFEAYASPRESFALSADRKRLLLPERRERVVLIDVDTRKEVRSFKHAELFGDGDDAHYCHRFNLSADGRLLAIWDNAFQQNVHFGNDKKRRAPFVHVWNLDEGRLIQQWKTGDIYETEFTPDGRTLVAQQKTKDGQSTLISWDLASGQEIRRANLPRGLSRFTFLPGGATFIGLDGERMALRRYDAKSGKELEVLLDNKKPIFSFALRMDSQRFAVAQPSRVSVHHIVKGEKLCEWPTRNHTSDAFESHGMMAEIVAFSPDGKMLAAADSRRLALWDLGTGARRHADDAHAGPVIGVHAQGQNVIVRDMDLGVSLWDLRTGKLRRRYECVPAKVDDSRSGFFDSWHGGVDLQAISPDGRKLAALWPDAPMQVIDLASGNVTLRFDGTDKASCVAFSPDGKLLVAPTLDGRIGAWDTTTGKCVRHFEPRLNQSEGSYHVSTGFLGLRFTANGRSLFASFYTEHHHRHHHRTSEIVIWESATGSVRRHIEPGLFVGDALSFVNAPDGKHIAVAGPHTVLLLDIFTAKEVRRFGGSSDVVGESAVFSPDGKLLVAGLESGAVRFWEVATGTILCDAPAHKTSITSLAFADAKTLVTGSIDGTAIAWDLDRLRAAAAAIPTDLRDVELDKLWMALGHHDAGKAADAMAAFAARPKDAIAFFKRRLQPTPHASPEQIAQWLADLRSGQYTIRQRASASLERLGGHARTALEKATRDAESIEVRRRLETMLHKLDAPVADAALLRAIRAIEVLERIGAADARRLLEEIATGGPGHRLTDDARGSVARLTKSP